VNQSKALNDLRGPFMVISASGMCEGGRVLHHLKNNIGDPRNTILLAGYQAEYTLGRKIEEQRKEVPIFGEGVPGAWRARTAGGLCYSDPRALRIGSGSPPAGTKF
jgi:predicted metal-dependent RNase